MGGPKSSRTCCDILKSGISSSLLVTLNFHLVASDQSRLQLEAKLKFFRVQYSENMHSDWLPSSHD